MYIYIYLDTFFLTHLEELTNGKGWLVLRKTPVDCSKNMTNIGWALNPPTLLQSTIEPGPNLSTLSKFICIHSVGILITLCYTIRFSTMKSNQLAIKLHS